jgi:hypothetical protein
MTWQGALGWTTRFAHDLASYPPSWSCLMKRLYLPFIVAASVAVIAACGSDNDSTAPKPTTVTFKATMTSASEVQAAPVVSSATGSFTGVLDTVTNVFTYDVTYSGLTGGATLGHIHGPASTAVSAGAVLNFATLTGATFTVGQAAGTAHGQATLNSALQFTSTINGDSLKKLMLAGLTYANIHTATYGQGEIRGQLVKQ